ncbi:hypothetical protein ND748_26750 [Frankia sp. AiPs1]|uniref:hypothetical protein n=1 Tax=Frankia sp. AiPs1 TaxID=573493 RepID=UPI0020437677|nr:hypothetical protein [Frankia sp. AiPs1]MCM3925254.1 hypothetical protein [Frankia sp. AiPs1]
MSGLVVLPAPPTGGGPLFCATAAAGDGPAPGRWIRDVAGEALCGAAAFPVVR